MTHPSTPSTSPSSSHEREEGVAFMPRFDQNGLITAVTVDHATQKVLMVAYINHEALQKTLDTGEVWYWSRSRQSLWHKGDTSGQIQSLQEMRVDCDQDCLLLFVKVGGDGGCCHTGRQSCFYRIVTHQDGKAALVRAHH